MAILAQQTFSLRRIAKEPFSLEFFPETMAIPAISTGVADLTNAEFSVRVKKDGKEVFPNFDESLGGRNMVLKSNLQNAVINGATAYAHSGEDYTSGFKVTGGNNGRAGYVKFPGIIKGNGKYTFSFLMRGTQSTTIGCKINICGNISPEVKSGNNNQYGNVLSFTTTVENYEEGVNDFVQIEYLNYVYYRFDKVKLEKGDLTPWTPAPEEILSKATITPYNCSAAVVGDKVKITTLTPGKQAGWVDVTATYGDGFTATQRFTWAIAKHGVDVQSVVEEFAISTSKTVQPTTGWSETQPAWESGKYLWSRKKIIYSSSPTPVYTGYAVSSEWEAVNDLQIGGRNLWAVSKTKRNLGYTGMYPLNSNVIVTGYDITVNGPIQDALAVEILKERLTSGYLYVRFKTTLDLPSYSFYVAHIRANNTHKSLTYVLTKTNDYYEAIIQIDRSAEYDKYYVMLNFIGHNPSITYPYTLTDIAVFSSTKATDWSPAPEDVEARINAEKERINDILSDNVADPSEKQWILQRWQEIQAEYAKYNNQAISLSVPKTAYEAAYSSLTSTIAPIIADLTTNSTVNGANIRTAFQNYYDARTSLLTAITAKVDELSGLKVDAATNLVNNPSRTGNINRWSRIGGAGSWNMEIENVDFFGSPIKAMKITSDDHAWIVTDKFDVDLSKAYEVRLWVLDPTRSAGNSTQFYFGLYTYNKSGSNITNSIVNRGTGVISSPNSNSYFYAKTATTPEWTELVAYILPYATSGTETIGLGKNVISNAIMSNPETVKAVIRVLNYNNAGTSRDLWIAHASVTETTMEAIRLARQSQVAADDAKGTANALKNFTDGAFADGLISRSERVSIEKYLNSVNETKLATDAEYIQTNNNSYLTGTAKTNLTNAKSALDTAYANLVYSINSAIIDDTATPTEKADVDTKYGLFTTALVTYKVRYEEAQKAIQDKIKEESQNYTDSKIAPALHLSVSSQVMTFDSNNNPAPSQQTIEIEAKLQNATGTATFTALPYAGTTPKNYIALGNTSNPNRKTLVQSQWESDVDRIEINAVLGTISDKVTIVKLKAGAPGAPGTPGQDSINGFLTNENVTFPASTAGVVSSFSAGNGQFKVYEGLVDKTSQAAFSNTASLNCTVSINSSGNYSVSAMTEDSATAVFRAVYKGVVIDRLLTLSKSRQGQTGQKGGDGLVDPETVAKINRSAAITDKFGTTVDGGLISTVMVELRESESATVTAGHIGIQGANKNLPAYWTGGTYTQALADIAKIILRHDGAGQLAAGNIKWDSLGNTIFSGLTMNKFVGDPWYYANGRYNIDLELGNNVLITTLPNGSNNGWFTTYLPDAQKYSGMLLNILWKPLASGYHWRIMRGGSGNSILVENGFDYKIDLTSDSARFLQLLSFWESGTLKWIVVRNKKISQSYEDRVKVGEVFLTATTQSGGNISRQSSKFGFTCACTKTATGTYTVTISKSPYNPLTTNNYTPMVCGFGGNFFANVKSISGNSFVVNTADDETPNDSAFNIMLVANENMDLRNQQGL